MWLMLAMPMGCEEEPCLYSVPNDRWKMEGRLMDIEAGQSILFEFGGSTELQADPVLGGLLSPRTQDLSCDLGSEDRKYHDFEPVVTVL